jgi:hypothetical protein
MDQMAVNGLLNANLQGGTEIRKRAIWVGLGRRTRPEGKGVSTSRMKLAGTSFRAIIALLFLPLFPATAVNWQQATPAAPWTARYQHECLAYNGKLWVLGGLSPWPTSVNDVWSSADGTNWTQVTAHAAWSARYDFRCAVFAGKMWLLGGGSISSGPFSDVWCSTDGANWTQVTANAPWGLRQSHACAVFQNKLWLLGGETGSQDHSDIWSTSDGTNWVLVTGSAPWGTRATHQVVVHESKMWVLGGGHYGGSPDNDIWQSQDGTNWTQISPTSQVWSPRSGHQAASLAGRIWVFGGYCAATGQLNDVWSSPDGAHWDEETATAPWAVRIHHKSAVLGNSIWLTGGAAPTYNDVWSCSIPDALSIGLVAYYPFDGNANDASGNGLHGASYGGVDYVAGRKGLAAQLDGVDDWLLAPASSAFSGTDDFTVSFWFKTTDSGGFFIDERGNNQQTGGDRGFGTLVHPTDSGISFGLADGSGTSAGQAVCKPATTAYQNGQWHHAVDIRQGNRVRMFIDGQLIHEASGNLIDIGVPNPLTIGTRFRYTSGSDNWLAGCLDELRIYNRALTAGEIWQLYSGYAAAPIQNVRASQYPGTRLVDIHYDVSSANAVYVQAAASADGTAWTIPFATASGDVGRQVTPGNDRHIVWDAGTDWPNHQTTTMTVQLTAGSSASNSPPFAVNTLGSGPWSIRAWADKNGNSTYDPGEEIPGAEVYYNGRTESDKVGLTASDGTITIPFSASQGATLFARKRIYDEPAVKAGHELVDNLMYTLWLDSDGPQYAGSVLTYHDAENSAWNGDWSSCLLTSTGVATAQAGGIVDLQLRHPIFEWNLTVASQPTNQAYLTPLAEAFTNASKYLFNVTDGQMKFGKIAILSGAHDWTTTWNDSDMLIENTSGKRPDSFNGGITSSWYPFNLHHMHFGIDRKIEYKDGTVLYTVHQQPYFTAIVHEFGHYAFGFYDEYLNGWGLQAELDELRITRPQDVPANYGLMDDDTVMPEMSSFNDYLPSYGPLYDPGVVTKQINEHSLKWFSGWYPCWQWLRSQFERTYNGIPIHIIVPRHVSIPFNTDRTGPRTLSPPYSWCQVSVQAAPSQKVDPNGLTTRLPQKAQSTPAHILVTQNGRPVAGALVASRQEKATKVQLLGPTDSAGSLAMYDLTPGDVLLCYKNGASASAPAVPSVPGDVIALELSPALPQKRPQPEPKDFDSGSLAVIISGHVSLAEYCRLDLDLQSNTNLSAAPDVTIHLENGEAIPMLMTNVTQNLYSGSVGLTNASAGTAEVTCTATNGDHLETLDPFTLNWIETNSPAHLSSQDGWTDLTLQPQSTASNTVAIVYQTLSPAIIPAGFQKQKLGAAMFVALGQSLEPAASNTTMNIRYSPAEIAGLNEETIELRKWNTTTDAWDPVACRASPEQHVVSAKLQDLGVYALFADPVIDATPPAAITNLSAQTSTNAGAVDLAWTDTGDDGTLGQATSYVLRFATFPIVATNWAAAMSLRLPVSPATNGTARQVTLLMPQPGVTYFFSLRATDKAGNLSPFGNCVSASSFASDSDSDGIPDSWEVTYGLNPTNSADANIDSDGDGLTNLQEYQAGTNPRSWDTDGDGMSDKWELDNGLNPLSADDRSADNDNDGLPNYLEYQYLTNPNDADTDHDGLPDKWEIDHGLSPISTSGMHGPDADPDGDGFTNLQEYIADTNPTNPNSYLRITSAQVNSNGVAIYWSGGTQARQYVQRAVILSGTNAWTNLRTNEPPTSVTDSYQDAFLTNAASFYRIQAERP